MMSGIGIMLSAGIVGNIANGSAIDFDIVLTASQTFANVAGTGFAITGDIGLNGQILTAMIDGAGGGPIPPTEAVVAFSGDIKGSGGIIKDGVRTLILSGNNDFDGPINYRGGAGNDVELTTTQPPPPPGPAPFCSVGAGPGGGPQVNVYNEAGVLVRAFNAYDPAFRGGVHVATADVTGDGVRDVITAPGFGGGPVVRIWDGVTGAMVTEYNAYDPAFRGGVFVAAARIDSDSVFEIVTSAGQGGGPHVIEWQYPGPTVRRSFFAFDPAFLGGVFVG